MARSVGTPGRVTSGRTTAVLWFGVLTGPVASLVMTQADYLAVPWACSAHASAEAMFVLHLVPVLLLVATAAAGVGAWRQLSGGPTDERRDAGATNGRVRFMAQLGVASSAFFVLVLLAQWLPVFILHPCQRG